MKMAFSVSVSELRPVLSDFILVSTKKNMSMKFRLQDKISSSSKSYSLVSSSFFFGVCGGGVVSS